MGNGGTLLRHLDPLLSVVRHPLVVLDAGLSVLKANPAFCAASGLTQADVEGARILDLGGGQWNIPSLHALLTSIAEGEAETAEAEVDHPLGGTRRLHLTARRSDGLILLALEEPPATETDDTTRTALRESEDRYRTLFASMDEAYAVVEVLRDEAGDWADFRFLDVNPAFMTHTGMPYPVGRTATELLGTPNPRWARIYGRVAETGRSVRVEEAELALDRIFSLNIMRLGGEGSTRVGVLFSDITDRTRAEDALRESEQRYRRLFDTINQVYVLAELIRDPAGRATDHRLLQVNPAFAQWMEVPADAAEGRAASEVIPGLEPALTEACERVARTGAPEQFEHRIAALDRWYDVWMYPAGGDRVHILYDEISKRKRAEAALRASEERYRLLFDSIDEGFCIIEVLFDAAGEPFDYRFLDINAAFQRQTGFSDATGRTMRDFASDLEQDWFDTYGRIVRTGQPERFERRAEPLDADFDVYAFRIGPAEDRKVGVIFNDVSERKRAQQALAASEKRHAFLVRFSDEVRGLSDPAEVARIACTFLSDRLGTDFTLWAEVDWERREYVVDLDFAADGTLDAPSRWPLDERRPFVADHLAGRTVVYSDISDDPRIPEPTRSDMAARGLNAGIAVPVVVAGTLRAVLNTNQRAVPRHWRPEEVAFVEAFAGRAWAEIERARAEAALRERERQFRALFEGIDAGVIVSAPAARDDGLRDWLYVTTNERAWKMFGKSDFTGRTMRDTFPDEDEGWYDICQQVFEDGEPIRFEREARTQGMVLELFLSAIETAGARQLMVVIQDVTLRRRVQDTLRESEERQAFLLRLSDELRALDDPDEITATAARLLGEWADASRAYFVEWPPGADYFEVRRDYTAAGEPSRVGRYPSPAFKQAVDRLTQGRTWTVEDAGTDPEIDAARRQYYLDRGVTAWVDVPLVKRGQLQAAFCLVQAAPRRWTELEIALAEETAERCWAAVERARAERALRASETRFRQFGEASSDLLWIRDAETLDWEYLSPAFEPIYGMERTALYAGGPSAWLDLIVPEDRDHAARQIARVRKGEFVTFEFRIRRPSDGAVRWLRNSDFPLLAADGRVERIGSIGHDITEEKRTAERMDVLVAELQHRTRNLIGVIRAMASRTLRDSAGLADFGDRFNDRLLALARANGLLSRLGKGGRVTFDELVKTELNGHGLTPGEELAGQVTVSGPEGIRLPSASVQTLALALHELLTNAVKHGALSAREGRLAITWELLDGDAPHLRLDWREHCTHPASDLTAVPGTGYGRELIERALPRQLGAETVYRLDPEGLHCVVTLPVSSRQGGGD